jgi:FkbM family methyltransferase
VSLPRRAGRARAVLARAIEGTRAEPIARAAWRRLRPFPTDPKAALGLQYDADLVKVMERVLQPSSCCVDAGAHIGTFLRHMVSLAPEGSHIAFEPLPGLAASLRRDFPTVEVRQQALADHTGISAFRAVPFPAAPYSGFSRRPWDTYSEEGVELIDVEVVRLDDVVPPGRRITLMKVDVEGAELDLFRGGACLLERDRPLVAFENSSDPASVLGVLGGCGLKLSLMHEWLVGGQPLSAQRFLDEALGGLHYFFLAHP